MGELRMIVAGSRNFGDDQRMSQVLREYLGDKTPERKLQFVSGTARGADSMGERFAREHGYDLKRFPAQWERYGRSAGYRRNAEMAAYAAQETGVFFAFWDGESRGTRHMISLAKENGLEVPVIKF